MYLGLLVGTSARVYGSLGTYASRQEYANAVTLSLDDEFKLGGEPSGGITSVSVISSPVKANS